MRSRVFQFIFLAVVLPLSAFEITDMDLHLKVTDIREDGPPEIWREFLILTAKPDQNVRYVGAAFSSDNFREIKTYRKNSYGVYFLVVPIPDAKTVYYRIVVDGVWVTDPENPEKIRDENGLFLSVLNFPVQDRPPLFSPVLEKRDGLNIVEFHIKARPDQRIYLAGDFNRWDPYMTLLKEEKPGFYSTKLAMKPGRYAYYYLIDGEVVPDPWNFQKGISRSGEEVSIFFVPG